MKKAWKIISNVFVWVMVIFTVAVMIFTIVSVNTFNRNDRDIFGYKAYIVLSDSMSATDFDAGDLVLVKKVDATTLQEGDIIAFTSQNPENYGQTVTHKIKRLTVNDQGEQGFVTYGTTTGTEDQTIVTYPYIQGKYQFALANVGSFFNFLRSTPGYIVCILIPFLLLIGYQGVNCVSIFRRYKAEQMEQIQSEKAELEAERKRSEEMMAELMKLKAQLENGGAVQVPPETNEPEENTTVRLEDVMTEFSSTEQEDA